MCNLCFTLPSGERSANARTPSPTAHTRFGVRFSSSHPPCPSSMFSAEHEDAHGEELILCVGMSAACTPRCTMTSVSPTLPTPSCKSLRGRRVSLARTGSRSPPCRMNSYRWVEEELGVLAGVRGPSATCRSPFIPKRTMRSETLMSLMSPSRGATFILRE